MFTDEILEKIFADKEMQLLKIGEQSTAVKAIERVLEKEKEKKPYATIAELFSTNE